MMKKLMLLISVLMLSVSAFGQINFGSWSNVQTTDTKNNTVEDHIQQGGGYSWIPDIHIMRENFIYMVAYEPISKRGSYDNTTRVVNLYCKDTTDVKNPWIVVCDSLFVGRHADWNDYDDVDFFKYDSLRHNTSHSKILTSRANLVISLDVHRMRNNCVTVTPLNIILKRVSDIGDKGMIFYTAIKW